MSPQKPLEEVKDAVPAEGADDEQLTKVFSGRNSSYAAAPKPGETRMCADPWTFAQVLGDGRVRPCCFSGVSLGFVTDEVTFEEVYNGEIAMYMRRQLLTGELDEYCRTCNMKAIVPVEQFQQFMTNFYEQPVVGAHAEDTALVQYTGDAGKPIDPASLYPAEGTPIASGGSPERAFNGDPLAFWISPERGAKVKGNSWIGLAFPSPQSVNRIEIEHPTDPMYHQSSVLVQSSQDGRDWTTVRRAMVTNTPFAVINVGDTKPAMRWRLLADSDNQKAKNQAWAPIEIRFFASQPQDHFIASASARPAQGTPIASGGSPEKSFNGDPATFWISPERGAEVKGKSWIGIALGSSQTVERIEIEHPTNPMYQQSRVLVQSSQDGKSWSTVKKAAVMDTKPFAVIALVNADPATHWRLLADSYNQKAGNQAWAPIEIRFYTCPAMRRKVAKLLTRARSLARRLLKRS